MLSIIADQTVPYFTYKLTDFTYNTYRTKKRGCLPQKQTFADPQKFGKKGKNLRRHSPTNLNYLNTKRGRAAKRTFFVRPFFLKFSIFTHIKCGSPCCLDLLEYEMIMCFVCVVECVDYLHLVYVLFNCYT